MNQAEHDLTLLAAAVAQRAPREWQEFAAGLKAYTDVKRDYVVNASLEELQKAQGRAQQCVTFTNLLADAVKNADLIFKKSAPKKL